MKHNLNIPPTYLLLCFFLNFIIFFILPAFKFIVFPYNLTGILIILLGLFFIGWSYNYFKKYDTPHDYEESKHLITAGPYKISRNPMYLGMTIGLLGISILLVNVICILSPIIFFLIINFIFVPFEENRMENTFDNKYLEYKKKVRRWI